MAAIAGWYAPPTKEISDWPSEWLRRFHHEFNSGLNSEHRKHLASQLQYLIDEYGHHDAREFRNYLLWLGCYPTKRKTETTMQTNNDTPKVKRSLNLWELITDARQCGNPNATAIQEVWAKVGMGHMEIVLDVIEETKQVVISLVSTEGDKLCMLTVANGLQVSAQKLSQREYGITYKQEITFQ